MSFLASLLTALVLLNVLLGRWPDAAFWALLAAFSWAVTAVAWGRERV